MTTGSVSMPRWSWSRRGIGAADQKPAVAAAEVEDDRGRAAEESRPSSGGPSAGYALERGLRPLRRGRESRRRTARRIRAPLAAASGLPMDDAMKIE